MLSKNQGQGYGGLQKKKDFIRKVDRRRKRLSPKETAAVQKTSDNDAG
jgi:hypothetical protein